jgi:K+-sensing histidine kinase KdpD
MRHRKALLRESPRAGRRDPACGGGSPGRTSRAATQSESDGAGRESRPIRHKAEFRVTATRLPARTRTTPRRVGLIVALVAIALCTLIIYPLTHIAPVVSLAVVYLRAVLVVSVTWGALLGVATGVVSALAFNYFHLSPVGEFTLRDSSNWVALIALVVVAALSSSIAEVTRARARDAEARRVEADLAAEMARLLLRSSTGSASTT